MDLKFAGNSIPAGPYTPRRDDLEQISDTPTRRAQHRRAQSETFFRFPDLDDAVGELNLDLPPTPPPILPNGPPLPAKINENRAEAHFRSLSMDADFFEGLGLDGPAAAIGGDAGSGPRHRHSNSMDGYSSATSSEVDSIAKKAMAADRLAELALIDPKRAKRFDLFFFIGLTFSFLQA